jgi:pimeloyl-ACP methyl ester carboxylesterase
MSGGIERAVSFGQSGNLAGIITEPATACGPDVIVLNTGLTHKIGSFRTTVDLARTLAASGFRTLRFDISGHGDSRVRPARRAGEDGPVVDTQDAMDFLAREYGARRFVLMGLCSGSDNAHRTSAADTRVVGAVHIEGIGYRTPKYYTTYYGPRFTSRVFIARQVALRIQGRPPPAPFENAFKRTFPPKERVERELHGLMARGVRLLYVYTRGSHLYTNYVEQLRDTFPTVDFGDRLEVEIHRLDSHTLSRVREREAAIARVGVWIQQHFADTPGAATGVHPTTELPSGPTSAVENPAE